MLQLVRVAGAHLLDARIIGAGGAIGAHHQIKFRTQVRIEFGRRNRVKIRRLRLRESGNGLFCRTSGDERCGACGMQQALGRKIVGVGVAGALAGDHADAAAGAHALAGGFDQRFVDADRGRGDRLEVEVGVVAARGKSLAQAAFQQPLGKSKFFKEIAFVAGSECRHE